MRWCGAREVSERRCHAQHPAAACVRRKRDGESVMSLDAEALESSFAMLAPRADELADRFYDRLFRNHPDVRPLFKGPMQQQKRHLVAALATIVGSLRHGVKLTQYLEDLAKRHVDYGVLPEHYPVVGENLVAVLAELAGPAWTPELEQAWTAAYDAIQRIVYESLEE